MLETRVTSAGDRLPGGGAGQSRGGGGGYIRSTGEYVQPPPPKSAAEFGRFRRFVLPICGVSVIWPIRSADLFGVSGILIGRCASFILGHWIMPALSILAVQIGTMKCFYCPQKDESVVPWDSLSPDDQTFLRDTFGCRSELHTHPAHSEMQMASLCAFLFFWQALFVHGKPIFSARQVTKNAEKIGPGFELTPEIQQYKTSLETAMYYHPIPQGPCTDREMIANQCFTPTQHTVGCKWEACVHLSSSRRLCLCMENQFPQEDM